MSMSVGPTILRACVIGIASIVPENSPLDSVVFRSSLQILLGVVYVILFYFVSAVVRVLTGRTALMDPNASLDAEIHNVQGDIEDIYEYDYKQDSFTLNHDAHTTPLKSITRNYENYEADTEEVVSGGLMIRVGQDVERRVRSIASVVARVGKSSHAVTDTHVASVDDHSPAHTRRGSVDDVSSDASSDEVDSAAGVRAVHVVQKQMRHAAKAATTGVKDSIKQTEPNVTTGVKDSIKQTEDVSAEALQTHTVEPPAQKGIQRTDSINWYMRPPRKQFTGSKLESRHHTYNGGFHPVNTDNIYVQSDRIYTDVYGLGFAAFVLHYTMDCSSMQPTLFLLIGLTVLGTRDVSCIALSVADNILPQTTLFTRALTVFSFILLVSAQICMLVGIVRVPSYHADARDGSVTEVPAPETVLEHFLARVLPILAPLALYMVSKRTSVAADVSKTLRRAMPTTVLIALWFITCFGAMSEKIRTAVGAISVNATVAELAETDVAVNMQLPLLIFSPFVKIPSLLAIVSCCLTRKTMDVVAALCIVFYAKQLHVVREIEMRQMLCCAFVFACLAWFCLTIRYCTPVVRTVASCFEGKADKYVIRP
jgi:hypothetical protein